MVTGLFSPYILFWLKKLSWIRVTSSNSCYWAVVDVFFSFFLHSFFIEILILESSTEINFSRLFYFPKICFYRKTCLELEFLDQIRVSIPRVTGLVFLKFLFYFYWKNCLALELRVKICVIKLRITGLFFFSFFQEFFFQHSYLIEKTTLEKS